MDGFNTYTSLPGGVTALDLFEIQQDAFKPGDLAELEDLLAKVAPEREKRYAASMDDNTYEQQLAQTMTVLNNLRAEANCKWQTRYISSLQELLETTTACDTEGIAAALRPLQDQLTLICDAHDLLTYKRLPAARLRRLESALELRKVEYLEATLLANVSHAQTLEKLADVFSAEGRVAIIGEKTEMLRKSAQEAFRQIGMAEDALRQERHRQLTTEQTRMAHGLVTRAEVASSIPTHQG